MPKPTWVKATCPPNGIPHNFSLSDDDMLTYYLEIFRNRTAKDKPYIDQYNSIEELEEDILPYYPVCDENELWMGKYRNIVTTGEL